MNSGVLKKEIMPFDGQQSSWTQWSTKVKALLKLRKEWHPFEGFFGYDHTSTKINLPTQAEYNDLIKDLLFYFSEKIQEARAKKINDILIDPGFGFAKTTSQNYTLLSELNLFQTFKRCISTEALLSTYNIELQLTNLDVPEHLHLLYGVHLELGVVRGREDPHVVH